VDAIGVPAPDPDDDHLFNAIVANIDGSAIERAAAASDLKPTLSTPEAPAAPPAAPYVPEGTPLPPEVTGWEQGPAAAANAAPGFSAAREPAVTVSLPVKPERPALVEPTRPAPPELGRAEQTGHLASVAGYALSVGVGAFGQIMFFGDWLGTMIPAPGNWVAATIGAAFAEIGMIGAGNSSLTKRRDGGKWKLLLAVACFVCAGAVTMQVAHWLPKGFGVALVFGLASFVGFLIHMVIEHSKIRDYEDRKADYAGQLAAYRAEQQARYEEDRAAYEAAMTDQQRQRRQVEQTTKKASAPTPPPRPAAKTPTKTAGGKATKPDALRIGVEQKAATPARLRAALTAAGYTLPASSSTVENWCKDIKALINEAN
jgi:hypothetical protein